MSPVLEDRGTRYASYWTADENAARLASVEEIEEARKGRIENYDVIAREYYDLTTDNLENGWGPKFHYCPFPDPTEPIDSAQSRHEHFLALMMGLKPGMRGLDAGCGCGGPSRELVEFARVHITGISINKDHIDKATSYARHFGLEGSLDYIEADFMHIPFPDSTFDFVYSTEATVYAPSLTGVYTEIARVLKPGGVFATYEWLMSRSFDPIIPLHLVVRQRIERGDGVVNLLTIDEGLAAFIASGLEMYHCEDMAERGPPERKWWYPIDGDTKPTVCKKDWWLVFRLRPAFFKVIYRLTWLLERMGVARGGRTEALKTQGMAVFAMRDGGKMGIFTPMFMMVGRKPEGWVHPRRVETEDGNSVV